MAEIAITGSFTDALGQLQPADTRQVAAFVARLLRGAEAVSLDAEILQDGGTRSIRSLRIGQGLRAIARYMGDQIMLVFVGPYDEAFDWARANCFGGDTRYVGIRITIDQIPRPTSLGLASMSIQGPWHCTIYDPHHLSRALEAAGISHGLVQ